MIFLKKLNGLQENIDRQLNKIRKIMYEQNEKFSEEIETIENNETEILE